MLTMKILAACRRAALAGVIAYGGANILSAVSPDSSGLALGSTSGGVVSNIGSNTGSDTISDNLSNAGSDDTENVPDGNTVNC